MICGRDLVAKSALRLFINVFERVKTNEMNNWSSPGQIVPSKSSESLYVWVLQV